MNSPNKLLIDFSTTVLTARERARVKNPKRDQQGHRDLQRGVARIAQAHRTVSKWLHPSMRKAKAGKEPAACLDGARAQRHAAADVEAGEMAQVLRGRAHGRVRQAPAAVQPQRRQPRAQPRRSHQARVAHLPAGLISSGAPVTVIDRRHACTADPLAAEVGMLGGRSISAVVPTD